MIIAYLSAAPILAIGGIGTNHPARRRRGDRRARTTQRRAGLHPGERLPGRAVVRLEALETRRVGPSEQGRLQGALNGLAALSGLAGPVFFTQVFAWSIGSGAPPWRAGVALLIGAGLMAVAWLGAFAVARVASAARA